MTWPLASIENQQLCVLPHNSFNGVFTPYREHISWFVYAHEINLRKINSPGTWLMSEQPGLPSMQQGAPNIPRVDELIDYFPSMETFHQFTGTIYFNQHQSRTNNHVEGWHSRMKKSSASHTQTSLHGLTIYIQREEAVTKAKIQSFRSGATARQWRHCMKEKEKKIQTLFERFNTGGMSLNEYLAAISHLTGF